MHGILLVFIMRHEAGTKIISFNTKGLVLKS